MKKSRRVHCSEKRNGYKNGKFVESKINYLEPTNLIQNTSNVTTPLTLRELSQTNIDTIDLGKFTLHRTKIKEVLHQIHRSKILNHSSKIESLVEHSVQVLESGFNSRLRGGVIMQVASPVIRNISNELSEVVVDGIARAVNGVMDGVIDVGENGRLSGNAYTSSGEEGSSSIIDKVRDGLRKVFDKKGRGEGDNGEVVFDEGSFGGSVANDNTVFLSSEGGGLQLDSSKEIIYIDTSDKNTRFIDTEFDPILPYSNQEIVAMSRMLHDTISKNRLSVDASLNLISVAGGVYGRVVAGIINGTLIARDIKDGRYSTIIADSGEIGMIPVPNRGINFNFARSSSRGKGVLLPSGNIVSSGNTQLMTFVGNGKSNNIGTNISINDIDPRILEKIDPRFYKALEIMNSSGWKIARGESVFGVERQLVGSSNALALVGKSDVYKYYPAKAIWTSESGTTQTYKIYQRGDIDWDMVRQNPRGNRDFIGKTNREAALAGFAPELKDGKIVQLHHVGQDSRGPLVEVSSGIHTKYHKTLHGQFGRSKGNKDYPVKHDNKWKADVKNYWKWRIENDK